MAGIRDRPGTAILAGTQEHICYELGDGRTTKSNEISVHPCVLFAHSHRGPGLTYLHPIELGPTLHEVALGSWRPTRGKGTRDVGDSVLVSAEEARVLHWFQLHQRLDDIDRCSTAVRDTATHCSSESGLRVEHRVEGTWPHELAVSI